MGRVISRRIPARGAAIALLLLMLSTLSAVTAAAHQRLLGSEPAGDAVAREAPRELRLHFTEAVQLTFTRIELIGPAGSAIALGDFRASAGAAAELVVPIRGTLQAGGYTVRWATASADGHPVRGEFTFSIAEGAAGLGTGPSAVHGADHGGAAPAPWQSAPGLPETQLSPDSPAYVVVRWITYVGLLGVIGAVAFATLVLGSVRRRGDRDDVQLITPASRRAASAGLAFTVLLGVAAAARLYAQWLALFGSADGLDAERVGTLLRDTTWGWGWLIQGGATLLAALGFAMARGGRRAGWTIAALAALSLAVTPALSGHAAALTGTLGLVAIAVDALHVLAAGGWLGTLLILLVVGIPAAVRLGPARRGAAVAALVRAFSPTALMFAALLVLTGIFAAVVHAGSLDALLASRYGTLLLVKLGIFAALFGTGAYNFLRVKPALGNDTGTARLRLSAGAEVGLAAAVLLVTAVLVATARP